MSILEKNKVDGIGKNEIENKIALMIADHLDWQNEFEHLTLLQNKINAYISFIESGQIYDVYPDAKLADGFILDFRFKYKITDNCKKLLGVINENLKHLEIELKINEP